MESELEKLELEIKGTLYQLTLEQLIKLCDVLQISGPGKEFVINKTRSQLVSHLVKHLERTELATREDEGMSELLNVQDIISDIQMDKKQSVNETVDPAVQDQESSQEEIETLRLLLEQKEGEMHDLMRNSMNPALSPRTPVRNIVPTAPNSSMWRKDFKISGQIGEPGQKDRLTFSSLARQIESGINRGYPESEITDAVIRAITPGLQLRSYLEGKENLTLPALRRILRSHYQEKGATELYKQLTSEVQSSKETPQNFLIRTMDLRQKILFASQEVESSLKYDPALVQSLFMHTVLTGLQNDNIKSDLQPYLLQTNTSDELLLEKVNIAVANEKERQDKKKHAAPSRVTAVNTVQSNDSPVGKRSTAQEKPAPLPPDLLTEIKEMRADMVLLKDLRAEVSQIRETIQKTTPAPQQPFPIKAEQNCMPFYHQHPPAAAQEYHSAHGPGHVHGTAQFQQRFAPQRYYPSPRHRPRCFACVQAGEEYCQHCFRCGSSEHFRAGCKAPRLTKSDKGSPLN